MKAKTNFLTWFKLFAVSLSFLFLAEVALLIFHIEQNLSLFTEHPDYPEYLIPNQNISRRYFKKDKNTTRSCIEPFKKFKKPSTVRIFDQGSSTAHVFLYETNGSFPRMLQYHFNQNFLNKNIEIINLSMIAVNSHTLLDFADDIIKQQPDAILIYTGHNEYYGAPGVGSFSKLGTIPLIVRLGIQLRKLQQFAISLDTPKKALISYKKTFELKPNLDALSQCIKTGINTKEFCQFTAMWSY